MKDKKQQKKQQGKPAKQKIKDAIPLALSFGKVDLIYRIEFTEKDLEKPQGENQNNQNNQENKEDKYYDIENFNSIKDLQFLKEENKKYIWDKIQLIPCNSTLEQLLIANKISKKKMHVDYIGFGAPKFEGDEEFFNEIFIHVNEKNYIDINTKALSDSASYSITFEFIFKDKTHSFSLGSSGGDGEKKEGGGQGGKKEGEGEKKEGEGEQKEGEGEKKEGEGEKKEGEGEKKVMKKIKL